MIIEKQLYTIDDVWEMAQDPDNEHVFLELIDGELITMTRPGRPHGLLVSNLSGYIWQYLQSNDIGELTGEIGFHPARNRYTLLGPDIAFIRYEHLPQPPSKKFISAMPDLAVEVLSPSETFSSARRKAEIYLLNGTALVWLVQPERRGVEVCRLIEGTQLQIEFAGNDATLSGEDVLPGFELEVSKLFAVLRD